jgi:hypothetical protein
MWVLLARVLIASGAGMLAVSFLKPEYHSTNGKDTPAALVARPPLVKVEGEASATKQKATFELFNPTDAPITVSKVVSDCSCVGFNLPEAVAVAPGESSRFSFDVDVPRFGTKRSRLEIRQEGRQASTVVFVDAKGAGRLPVVVGTDNPSPTFVDLNDLSATQEVVVRTWEDVGSTPWLGGAECSSPLVNCRLTLAGEEKVLALGRIERKYVCRVGWNRLPLLGEVSASLTAIPANGDRPIRLGTVSAALKRNKLEK